MRGKYPYKNILKSNKKKTSIMEKCANDIYRKLTEKKVCMTNKETNKEILYLINNQ